MHARRGTVATSDFEGMRRSFYAGKYDFGLASRSTPDVGTDDNGRAFREGLVKHHAIDLTPVPVTALNNQCRIGVLECFQLVVQLSTDRRIYIYK